MNLAYWISAILAGALIGSFLNVLIHRGPSVWGLLDETELKRGTLLQPRSYCPACRAPIPAWRLIPVVSYVAQGGRCAACKAKIPVRYLLVEIGGVLIAAAAYGIFGFSTTAFFAAVFGWTLLALAVIDWETGYLPDWLTLPLVVAGLLANFGGRFVPLADAFIGAAAGYVVFRLISAAFRRLRNYEGLGQGDAKLLAAVGAWAGWAALPAVVLAGSLSTLAGVAVINLFSRSIGSKTEIPFGPGLCAAGFIVLIGRATGWL